MKVKQTASPMAGAGIGTAILPGLGTAIGGTIGAVVFGIAGSYGGEKIADYVIDVTEMEKWNYWKIERIDWINIKMKN